MSDKLEAIVSQALAGMTAGPLPLLNAIKFYGEQAGVDGESIGRELPNRIAASPNDDVRKLLNRHLGQWDWEANATWTGDTMANTIPRRNRICDLLCIDVELRKVLDKHLPPYQGAKAVVIEDPKAVRDWYTLDFRRKHNFYWKKLREFLARQGKIDGDGINSIEASADRVVERLGDPASSQIYKARGLVVGYVQSGKTTNFTAVIAKAIDAGYRLIIILSGTTNLLRNQTQRRLDMELVGLENILRGATDPEVEHDYVEDEGWPEKFITYGKQPSLLGSVDIHRLTSLKDFSQRDAGLNPLEFEFEKRERRLPLYDRENLDHAGARIAVVKKVRDRLKALKAELTAVGKQKCADVPTLIIDDESDQASVNTVNPRAIVDNKLRSGINEDIVAILSLLPRANYLGYTATPFANVFINPKDPKDLYPRSFIISLPRPSGYMGARDFVDFEPNEPGRLSNAEAHIRDIPKRDTVPRDDRLLEALDVFVLTGAIKKYREKKHGLKFKHHTMLVHHSMSKDDHKQVVRNIETLWRKAGYDSPSSSSARLEKLLKDDILPVWTDRGQPAGLALPEKFSDLRLHLGAALDEIRKGKSPVLMVNSAEGAEVPDFDGRTGVWKIIVGGAKLSRGYTIEGLTVSYFRRRTAMQDTLMQMGRWFGYRLGYADLVRLYIGRSEPIGQTTIDLYKAFEAMCRDEEAFRAQLAMYEGRGGITPLEVPALVFNSHPRLRPTSRQKMYNAKITWAAFDYREPTSQAASGAARRSNERLFSEFISRRQIASVEAAPLGSRSAGIKYKWAQASHAEVVSLLVGTKWDKADNPIAAEIEFLRRKLAPVDSWVFLAPQISEGGASPWKIGAEDFECISRTRLSESRFGVFSSPKHLAFAKWLVGGTEDQFTSTLQPRERTGIILFYPTRELLDVGKIAGGVPVMGFGIVIPRATGPGQRIAFSV